MHQTLLLKNSKYIVHGKLPDTYASLKQVLFPSTFVCTPLVFEHQAKMFVRQGVDSEHLKVCPHDQKYYALEPIDTDQFFFFCDSKSSESDSILGSYYAKRYTRLPTTHLVFRSFGAWITITSSTFFHHTFPSS